ncbi:trypsin-like serine protease [Microbacterium sp. NPDC089695]|uniref:trypsin-like serine protease n=1 Tax=Microbacterium sp. NPDC089695 TaxID=3364198 RepID=UPI0037F35C15
MTMKARRKILWGAVGGCLLVSSMLMAMGEAAATDPSKPDVIGGEHRCSGPFYDSSIVLTAARCVGSSGLTAGLSAVFGRHDLSTGDGLEIVAVGAWIHPKCDTGVGYDLAFLTLAEPVLDVEPVTLPTPGTDALIKPGHEGTMFGWGRLTPPSASIRRSCGGPTSRSSRRASAR